jgi:hypothetical protein
MVSKPPATEPGATAPEEGRAMASKPERFFPKTDPSPAIVPLPGSLHDEWVRCGKPTCHCRLGGTERHGPYVRRHYREDRRTRRRYVRRAQVPAVCAAIAAWQVRHPSRRTVLRQLRELACIVG